MARSTGNGTGAPYIGTNPGHQPRPSGFGDTPAQEMAAILEGMHDQFNPLATLRPVGPLAGGPVQRPPLSNGTPVRPGSKPKPKPKPRPTAKPSAGSGNRVVNRYGTTSSGGSGGSTGASGGTSAPRQPKTYKGPNGEVRRYLGRGGAAGATNRPAAAAAKPVKDPLEELVDQIIASRLAPIQDERRQLREQSAADVLQQQRLNEQYQQQLGGIRSEGQLDMGAALTKAAELRGISAETLAANQEWLSSLMADTNGGTGDAQVAEASAQQNAYTSAAHDTMAREIATRGEGMSDWAAKQQVVGTAQTNELINQERLRRAASERGMASEISQVRGGRAELLYQMQAQQQEAALKQAVAEQEWGLKVAAQSSTDAYRQGQLALGSQRNQISAANAANRGDNKDPKNPYGNYAALKIPKQYDSVIKTVYADINKQVRNEDAPLDKPWDASFEALKDNGLSPNYAAQLATTWYGPMFEQMGPRGARQALVNRGVAPGIVNRLLKGVFGNAGVSASTRPGGLGAGLGLAGQILNGNR